MWGIRQAIERLLHAVGSRAAAGGEAAGSGEPSTEAPAVSVPPEDAFVAEATPAAPAMPAAALGQMPAARLALSDNRRAEMVNHLEWYARETGAPDGTHISPDNTSRWIAEFVVRHFQPRDDVAGENAAYFVIDAYRFGSEQYLTTRLGFAQRDRLAHDAIRVALEGIPAEIFRKERILSLHLIGRIEEGINAFLGAERVEWVEGISPGSSLGGRASRRLNRHIANHVVFRLNPQTYEEAEGMGRRIVQIGDDIVSDLRSLGMAHAEYARSIAASVVQEGISPDRTAPFDEAVARALLREAIDRRFRNLEDAGPEMRDKMRLGLDHGEIKAATAFDQLLAVRRNLPARGDDPGGSGPDGAMLEYLERFVRNRLLLVGTNDMPRWIAEFVIRRFRPATDIGGEEWVRRVADAYHIGWSYGSLSLSFEEADGPFDRAMQSVLEGIPREAWVAAGAAPVAAATIEAGIDAFLGKERVRWFQQLRPDSRLGGERDSDWLDRRIAHYVVFHLRPQTYEEAEAMARRIVRIGDSVVSELQSLGLKTSGEAFHIAYSVVQEGVSASDAVPPFDEAMARALVREEIDERAFALEKVGPKGRARARRWYRRDGSRANLERVYQQLLAVRRNLAARDKGPKGGGPQGSGPGGGAAPAGGAFGGVIDGGGQASGAGDGTDAADATIDPGAAAFIGAEAAWPAVTPAPFASEAAPVR